MGNKLLSVLKQRKESSPSPEASSSTQYNNPKQKKSTMTRLSKWNVLKEHVVPDTKTSKSLKEFLNQQYQRKKLMQRIHVNHSPTIIKLEPLGFSDRRKSTNTKLMLTELARFHKQGIEHARVGVDTAPPKALEWTVKRTMRRIKDEVTRCTDLSLPRTLKNHWSNEQLIYYRENEKQHKYRIANSKSFIDNNLPKGFKTRRYKTSSFNQRRKTYIQEQKKYNIHKENKNLASSHYQRWLLKGNTFYGRATACQLFNCGNRPATVGI